MLRAVGCLFVLGLTLAAPAGAAGGVPGWVHEGTVVEFSVVVEADGLEPERGRNRYTVVASNATAQRLLLENDRMIPTGPNNELLPDTLLEMALGPNRTLLENGAFSFWLWIPPVTAGDTVHVFDKNYTVHPGGGGDIVLKWEGVQEQTLAYVTSTLRYSSKELSLVSLVDDYHDVDDERVMRVSMERRMFVLGSPPGLEWGTIALTGAAGLAILGVAGGYAWWRLRGSSAG